ncbi:membrane protein insertion efficiency factor YidD [Spirilliplanes yamanashiensis]|nr:membrane protein insertion efficiency factor YidD [Spirilliplanes yamanashiensis]MDP9818784.1 putative membrane protein insertion efficiency factor [Spirilliplanes yamanashiensis]
MHVRKHKNKKKKKDHWYDGCDCDGCDGCDLPCCDLGLLSTALTAVAVLAPRADRFGAGAIRFYRRRVSHRLPVSCPYTPSCSAYGLEAVQRHGMGAGGRLAAARLRRCRHGVPRGTADPVP